MNRLAPAVLRRPLAFREDILLIAAQRPESLRLAARPYDFDPLRCLRLPQAERDLTLALGEETAAAADILRLCHASLRDLDERPDPVPIGLHTHRAKPYPMTVA